MNEGEITSSQLVLARGEAPEVLEIAKPVLDLVPTPVKPTRTWRRFESVALGGNHASDLDRGEPRSQRIRIIGAIRGEPSQRASLSGLGVEWIEADQVMPLACRQCQGHRGVFVGAGDPDVAVFQLTHRAREIGH